MVFFFFCCKFPLASVESPATIKIPTCNLLTVVKEITLLASEDQHFFFGVTLDFHNDPNVFSLRSPWLAKCEAKGKTLDGLLAAEVLKT